MGFSVEHVYKTMRVMRFAPELAGKVMDGSKTVSRRRSSYEPGSLCAIECEGERLGTLAVTSVREERLGDVTSDDVALEGFDRASDFFNFWWSVFPEDSLNAIVYRVEFYVVDDWNGVASAYIFSTVHHVEG